MKFFGFRIVSTILQIFKSLFCPPPIYCFFFWGFTLKQRLGRALEGEQAL